MSQQAEVEATVPDSVLPHGSLPPMRWRDLPESISLRRMIGPSIILAGLALGSGEYVIWPFITSRSGFVFFWACLLGVVTQYFLNMEIARWTLATGESAITGFCRINKHLAGAFLLMNIIPWMIPAWATGAAQIINWLFFDGSEEWLVHFTIAGLILSGVILTAGPIVYETVEKVQMFLVTSILVLVVLLAILVVRADAVTAQIQQTLTFGMPAIDGSLTVVTLLGALAFAGAGGTTNLGQSNYIKDKGYGMGRYIGRITSPMTGQPEAVVEIGYHFPHTPENMARWKAWWRSASIEHSLSFLMTCLVCLVLLTLIAYSIFFDVDGEYVGPTDLKEGMGFVHYEANVIGERVGDWARIAFLVMGVAILFTTEFGVLDVSSRISTDIVKVNWLRENRNWPEGKLYFYFLWGEIILGTVFVLVGVEKLNALTLFKLTASLNGGVMFLYSIMLLILNRRVLPAPIRMPWYRAAVIVWSILFFGTFTVWAAKSALEPLFVKPKAEASLSLK